MRRVMRVLAAGLLIICAGLVAAGDDDDEVEGGTIGTGIMGEISGKGSIHVGGLRVILPDGLLVQSAFGPRLAADLTVGETVLVEASDQNGTLTANRIRPYTPIVAPVDAVSSAGVTILGLTLDAPTSGLAAGDWVAVSGLWQGARLSVSSLRKIAPQDEVQVSGTFTRDAVGAQFVGPLRLATAVVQNAKTGADLTVTGTWTATEGAIAPSRIETGLFPAGLGQLLVEGYMSQPDADGVYYIYGTGVVFVTEDPTMQVPAARSVFCMSATAPGTFSQLLSLEAEAAARREQLEALPLNGARGC